MPAGHTADCPQGRPSPPGLAAKGQTLSYTDVTIAAVALINDVPVVTDNRKHFPMSELHLIPLPGRS